MPADFARRKLREAAFFLAEMRRRDGSPRLDMEEEFGYFLSGFLSAARSVSFVLRKENPARYEGARDLWLTALDPAMRAFVDVMRDQRNAALKEGTIAAQQEVEQVSPLKAYGKHPISVPIILPWAFAEGATIGVTKYVLDVDSIHRPAVEACQDYLAVLELLVSRFEPQGGK